jgi:eukaryotic-like serine/threonine-protein kinase
LGVCQSKGLHRTATGLYAGAFSADPQLADNLQAGHRYRAACFAALAAAGQGKDSQELNDEERNRLRHQALDWLRAELTAWDNAKDRALALQKLTHWQLDAGLAGVRDKEALAQLPQVEREAWLQLWSSVAKVLQKTRGQK